MGWFWEDKEYFGSSFMTIIEPDITIRAAKKQTMFSAQGDLGAFNKQFWSWKHSYKKRYSEDKMYRYGYKPLVGGSAAYESTPEINAFMLSKDPLYDHIMEVRTGGTEMYSIMVNYLQWHGYNYSMRRRELVHNGTIYHYQYVNYKENPDPALPDDFTKGVGTFKSDSGSIHTEEFPMEFVNIDSFQVRYYREPNSNYETETYIYIGYLSDIPGGAIAENDMVMSAIVPIKEFGVIAEETSSMRRMLRKMGVKQSDFDELLEKQDDVEDSTESEAIDNAYILHGLPLRNPYEIVPKIYNAEEAVEELSAAFMTELDRKGFYKDNKKVTLDPEGDREQSSFSRIGTNDSEARGTYDVTEEFAKKWYDDHLKEQAYLSRGLFRTFAYYANAMDMQVYENEHKSLFYIGNSIGDRTSALAEEQIANEIAENAGENDPIDENGDGFDDNTGETMPSSLEQVKDIGNKNREGIDEGPRDVDVTVRSGEMFGTIRFNITIKTKQGTVRGHEGITSKRKQGSFHFSGTLVSKENDKQKRTKTQTIDSDGYDKITIRVQKNPSQYQEMIITGYNASFGFEAKTFYVTAGYNKNESRILLPYFILQDVKFTEFATINEHSFAVYAYMKVTVEFDWSTFLWTIVGTIVMCFTVVGCGVGWAMLAAVLKAVIIQAIMLQLAEMIDNAYLLMALKLAYGIYQAMSGNFDLSSMTAENFLPIAQQIATTAYQVHRMKEAESEAEQEKQVQAQEGIENKMSAVDEMTTIHPKMEMGAHYSFKETNSPEAFYNSALNEMYDYEKYYNVDGEIELRKQVKSG